MGKTKNELASLYKNMLASGELQTAYEMLLRYLMQIKAAFAHDFGTQYKTGNVSPGYMDYSYFPFQNEFLRKQKLRFGIIKGEGCRTLSDE